MEGSPHCTLISKNFYSLILVPLWSHPEQICLFLTGQTFRYLPHTGIKNESVLVSYSCHNKLPQTGWLKPIKTYYHTVLESRSPKSRCLKCGFLLKAWERIHSMSLSPSFWWLPAMLDVPWLVDVKLQSLSPFSHDFPLCMSLCFLLFFLL